MPDALSLFSGCVCVQVEYTDKSVKLYAKCIFGTEESDSPLVVFYAISYMLLSLFVIFVVFGKDFTVIREFVTPTTSIVDIGIPNLKILLARHRSSSHSLKTTMLWGVSNMAQISSIVLRQS